MKFVKWKILIITCIVCFLAIIPGVWVWNDLPDMMAVHFNIYNEADNFATKEFAVFGLPVLMALLQALSCVLNDINKRKYANSKKAEMVSKWIIPVLTIILQFIIIGYNLGYGIDVRKNASLIVGVALIVIGSYLPELDYIKKHKSDIEKAKKINKFNGFVFVTMGIIMLITTFLPPISTLIWILIIVLFSVVEEIYLVKTIKKNK